jgi:hypothetical protein
MDILDTIREFRDALQREAPDDWWRYCEAIEYALM